MAIDIMPGEVTPTLFVGLGGSGGRAIGRIARRLRASSDWERQYRDLVRFVAIDTNDADLARLRKGDSTLGRVDDTVLISDFDKVAYAELRRGGSFADADPYFTQWVHPDYRFREESGAGAGQIRIESRLGFFRSVEVGKLTKQLSDVISALKSHQHGMRRHGAAVQAFVYFSVAGGTGSGAFLPFAYFVRDLLGDKSSRLVGFAILPEAFEQVVGMNRDGVFANGYAALKELEHFMRLDTQSPSSPKELVFHYDPRDKSKTRVDRRPYDLVYLVDRPEDFSLGDVGEALADATYVQIFSPVLGDQQADYDNYTKESRALFPQELGGDGYTAFYGTLGASLLVLPKDDLLGYAAQRYAATMVRRYLLLDDPVLVGDALREKFRQFAIDREELDRLSPDVRAIRIDEAFLKKMDLLAEQDREGGVWRRLWAVRDSAAQKLEGSVRSLEEDLRARAASIREISADRILDDQWTPAATVSSLEREAAAARQEVQARLATLLAKIESGDYWADFLSKAGTDAYPELGPYEQRYVLVRARDAASGALSPKRLDELSQQVNRLRAECDLSADGKFRSEMESHARELKRTFGGLDKLITRKDKDFEAARERAVGTFNETVQKLRTLLVRQAVVELLTALGRSADALRASFRGIEADAGRLASELEEKARRCEFDGGVAGLTSESNDYALDVEVLQHPSGRVRFWSWYYEDQIATQSSASDEHSVLGAVREALKPKFDENGRPRPRSAREIVAEIEDRLVAVARAVLGPQILGDPSSDDPARRLGLRLDDALALESEYYAMYTESQGRDAAERLAAVRPLNAGAIWKRENVRQYARRKLEAALAKAQPLTAFNPEAKSMLAHADMLLLGIHESLRTGPLAGVIEDTTHGMGAQMLAGWNDPLRVLVYRSILGVPVYCFPNINDRLKPAYRRFQDRPERAWPVHIEKGFESLPDLDPDERKREAETQAAGLRLALTALALGEARGLVGRPTSGIELRVDPQHVVALGGDVVRAARALEALRVDKPAVFELAAAPLFADARLAADSAALRGEVKKTADAWSARRVALELAARRDPPEQAEYEALARAAAVLAAVLGAG